MSGILDGLILVIFVIFVAGLVIGFNKQTLTRSQQRQEDLKKLKDRKKDANID